MLSIYTTYISLFCTICSLWIPIKNNSQIWNICFVVTLILSLLSKVASLFGATALLVVYGLLLVYKELSIPYKSLLLVAILLISTHIALNVQTFHNLLLLHQVQFSPDGMAFTLYIKFAETMIGIMIIRVHLQQTATRYDWKNTCIHVLTKLPIMLSIILFANIVGYVKFDPKLPKELWMWAIANLFFTCLTEEALFRVLLQNFICHLKVKYAEYVAFILPGLLFGLVHYGGGIQHVILATAAGILYGWVYKTTARIEASILTHFVLNLLHILLFTYPALR